MTPTTAADKAANAEGVVEWPIAPAPLGLMRCDEHGIPDIRDVDGLKRYIYAMRDYERARYLAALSRLRIAVEHINHEPRCAMMQPVGRMACDCGYHEALAACDLPPGAE